MKSIQLKLATIIVTLLICHIPYLRAETIVNTAGNLSLALEDKTIQSLTITGSVNAIDFSFIRDNLSQLETLNLTDATITGCTITDDDETTVYLDNELPAFALFGMKLLSVKLPDNIVAIGESALAGNPGIVSFSFPKAITTIGDNAFNSTGLTTVTIPKTITTLGTGAFARCNNLTSATFSPINEISLSDETFLNCLLLKEINLGKNIIAIGTRTFAGCSNLQDLNLTVGSKIKSIGLQAFEGVGMNNIDLTGCKTLETIGMYAFACTDATIINLPASVTEVGEGAFFYDTKLERVSLPNGITSLADFIFAGNTNYPNTDLMSDNITTIGDYAFYNWDQLVSFIIPASVNYIGTRAMAGMSGLKTVNAKPTTVPELGENVWEGVDQANIPLIVDQNSIDAYKAAPQWQEFKFEDITTNIDDNITTSSDASNITAYFTGTQLLITSTDNISEVQLYALNGVLLNRVRPNTTETSIETMNYFGKVYIVNVALENGNTRSFKLLRE